MNERWFGDLSDGRPVYGYTISNGHGISAEIIGFGAAVRSLVVPDRSGQGETWF